MMLVQQPMDTLPTMKRQPVFCANCGGFGHIYKTCNHPITSYGIICYRLYYNKTNNTISPRYLLVQRKDSLSFVEFMRGKYDLNNRKYLMQLFSNMTDDERQKIYRVDFDTLWKEMWCKTSVYESNRNFSKEYNESREKFNLLKKGIYIKSASSSDVDFFNLEYVLDNTTSEYNETEWGFPKGRRNINEDDVHCALREFREETGIHTRNIRICENIKPLEEIFSGTNKVRYRHIYYVAKYMAPYFVEDSETPCPTNNVEIKNIEWFDYNDAQTKIRKINVERRELFKRLNAMVMRTINNF